MTNAVILGPRLRERDWQGRVVDLARLRGWRVFHDQDSRRNPAGLPDLVLVRRGRLVFAELKTQTGRVSAEQNEWLLDLASVPGVEVYLWRPDDWPTVVEVLAP